MSTNIATKDNKASKRPRESNDTKKNDKVFKKFKYGTSNLLEPGTSGCYATCVRRKEKSAEYELLQLFEEKYIELYGEEELDDDTANIKDVEEDIGDQIQKELQQLQKNSKNGSSSLNNEKNKSIFTIIELNCECVIFIKIRKPIEPEFFIHEVIKGLKNQDSKRTRYLAKLTPITFSCNASMSELEKLCDRVLAPHFHTEESKKGLKFAIDLDRRNFNTLDKMEMIKLIAKCVSKNNVIPHTVDLKNFDKLVLVECFKNNIGMSVVDKDYRTDFKKYNIQQIFEQKKSKK
ncbi:related to tRNA acetyltransferase TAN1 [Saccharomycodes ludwigii]|uniref:Related to tRNA acetyltransferase TAN1 n=1 Tax=Saccharomycodes ludwigii TaxID=36035 RepID=A0A376B3Y9_9ASCO|nr:hypothetical protein SCDLUD_002278 [Saccharomycodes ludwigii]KAH3900825.1 hypothetical protein SCDLUD_002278 [Saccharomycodes ludwigii]SSD59406.1 related to tRNA acetyltransferase TAN1 [Saccharomycodes ludwigii]